jgi:hypothetical protein
LVDEIGQVRRFVQYIVQNPARILEMELIDHCIILARWFNQYSKQVTITNWVQKHLNDKDGHYTSSANSMVLQVLIKLCSMMMITNINLMLCDDFALRFRHLIWLMR